MGEEKIVTLKIKALEAHEDKIRFYKEENGIWLSEIVPPQSIDKL